MNKSRIIISATAFFITVCLIFSSCANRSTQGLYKDDNESVPVQNIEVGEEVSGITDNEDLISGVNSGDFSKLSEKDKALAEKFSDICKELFDDSMSEYEKELAAYDYLVTHCEYDTDELDELVQTDPDSRTPYGALINGKAVCMGYTTAFQLFMDYLNIESIIVNAEANGEEHAWNMVKLGGDWYHVDVTWGDFIPDEPNRPPFHLFLNSDDAWLEPTHVWERNVPEANSDNLNYYRLNGLIFNTETEVDYATDSFKKSDVEYIEFVCPTDLRQYASELLSNYCKVYCFEYGENTVVIAQKNGE